jgi:hypothetical protein
MALLQENGRGASDVPMITGIIGFVATIPGTVCAGMCGAFRDGMETAMTGSTSGFGKFWLVLNLTTAIVGLVCGIRSKATPRTSGAIMIGSAIITLLISFFTANWIWGLIAVACFATGGAVSLTQEKKNV